jgi:hypothetical protein
MTRLLKLVALALVMTLIAAACGSDSGGSAAPADDPLVQAVVADILAEEDGLTADRGEAECFAGGVVGGIGADRLAELGVTVDNVGSLDDFTWSEDEANLIIDKMFDCTDVSQSFVDDLGGSGMTSEQTACLADAFDKDTMRKFFVAALTGDESADSFTAIAEAMSGCGLDLFG